MVDLKLIRTTKLPDRTLGELYYDSKLLCFTLELPYLDNKNDISCIPCGHYIIQKWFSPHFKRFVYKFDLVPNRDHVLIHIGNFPSDIKGCVIVGMNYNNKHDLVQSTGAFNMFMSRMNGQEGKIEVCERG